MEQVFLVASIRTVRGSKNTMQNRQVLEKEWAEEKPVNENMEWRAWWSTPLIYLYIIRYIFLIHSLCIWRSLLLYQKVINKPSVCQCFHTAIMDARTHY